MVMYTNSFPYTFKPLSSFFPQGLYKKEAVQKIDPLAVLEPGFMKFADYWLLSKDSRQPEKVSD